MTPKVGTIWERLTHDQITSLLLERVDMLRCEPGGILSEAYQTALKEFARFVNDGTLPDR